MTGERFCPAEEKVKYHTKVGEWVVPETGQEFIGIFKGVQPSGKVREKRGEKEGGRERERGRGERKD